MKGTFTVIVYPLEYLKPDPLAALDPSLIGPPTTEQPMETSISPAELMQDHRVPVFAAQVAELARRAFNLGLAPRGAAKLTFAVEFDSDRLPDPPPPL